MAREKALKEKGVFVQDCKCGLMLAKSDFVKGVASCPRCGEDNQACDSAKPVAEVIDASSE